MCTCVCISVCVFVCGCVCERIQWDALVVLTISSSVCGRLCMSGIWSRGRFMRLFLGVGCSSDCMSACVHWLCICEGGCGCGWSLVRVSVYARPSYFILSRVM